MKAKVALSVMLWALPGVCAEWNPKLAAEYLDARQKEWFVWPRANAGAKPCISCHTGLTYLWARPALRKALGESAPTAYETGLLKSLSERLEKREPAEAPGIGVESVLAALLVGGEPALDRMWALQIREGDAKGSWHWFSLNDDPWEMPESNFYGATLAAIAFAAAPAEYRARPAVKERAADMAAFLRSGQERQPLHNRAMLLLASKNMPELLSADERRSIVAALWQRQQADGGWTIASLGPFKVQEAAPRQEGSNGYATALVAYVMGQVAPGTPKLAKALGWLRAHQEQGGYWSAESMNKVYPAGSMESRFMKDAATAFAVMALTDAK